MIIHTLTRIFVIASLSLAMILMLLSVSYAGNNIGLRNNSVVTDNTIKLGDVFYGLTRDEDRVLGSSPQPGKEMILNARTLLRIAVALDLPWRPTSSQDHVSISRDATIIDQETIKNSIHAKLKENGVNSDYDLILSNNYRSITLPADQPATLEITNFTLDKTRTRFEATISAPSAKNPVYNLRITGKIEPTIMLPVLRDNLQGGTIIKQSDIDHIRIKEREFSSSTIIDSSTLVGMTAKRAIIAGRPIQMSNIIAPQIIERGSLVTLSLIDGILNLTTQAKALENGAKGDVIRVVNTSSNKTIQAIITGNNQVSIILN